MVLSEWLHICTFTTFTCQEVKYAVEFLTANGPDVDVDARVVGRRLHAQG